MAELSRISLRRFKILDPRGALLNKRGSLCVRAGWVAVLLTCAVTLTVFHLGGPKLPDGSFNEPWATLAGILFWTTITLGLVCIVDGRRKQGIAILISGIVAPTGLSLLLLGITPVSY